MLGLHPSKGLVNTKGNRVPCRRKKLELSFTVNRDALKTGSWEMLHHGHTPSTAAVTGAAYPTRQDRMLITTTENKDTMLLCSKSSGFISNPRLQSCAHSVWQHFLILSLTEVSVESCYVQISVIINNSHIGPEASHKEEPNSHQLLHHVMIKNWGSKIIQSSAGVDPTGH